MISFELDFYPREDKRGEDWGSFDWALEHFLNALDRDNNLVSGWGLLELPDRVQVRCTIPELVSLDAQNWNTYARSSWQELLETSERNPVFREVVEKTRDEDVCKCHEPTRLILFTTYQETDYCIRCGDCGEWVPLYRLPYIEGQEEHFALSAWRSIYANLDRLWMGGIGEQFSDGQLGQHDSELVSLSRKLALELSEKAEKPVYISLMHYSSKFSDNCPRCGSLWKLLEKWHDFDYRCEVCFMVSTLPIVETTLPEELHP